MAKVFLESSLPHLAFVYFPFSFIFKKNSIQQNFYMKEKYSTGFNKSASLYPSYDSV